MFATFLQPFTPQRIYAFVTYFAVDKINKKKKLIKMSNNKHQKN